ncbi:MAG: hypothetical protein MJB57_03270 [Gemmatimonadetes bacterium]|nr:hypothetical protein [Gemmatimonadota bacterium]
MPAADLAEEAEFFGGRSMPRWRIGFFALEHSMWTRGQMVPYFQANSTPVPENALF